MPGSQQPRINVVPPAVSSAGVEAIEVAEVAGLHLDPWEEMALMAMCGQRQDGKWAAFEFGLNVPRQNGKGTVQEVRELAGAFSFGERLLIHSAHEQITSSEHFRRLLQLIEHVPEFDQRVLKVVKGKGSEAIELRGGQRILFKTRTNAGGLGLTGDYIGLDEAMIIPLEVTGVLLPTMAARSVTGNPQVGYFGSQVDQMVHDHGVVFARVRERALAGAPRVAYLEWSGGLREWLEARGMPFDPDRADIDQVTAEFLDDQEEWARANPGLGVRISMEHIANERGALGSRSFAVYRLGITDPPDTSEDAERVIAPDVVVAARELDASRRISSRYVYAVAVNWERTWAAIGVAGERDDAIMQGAVVEHQRGTGWIVDRCVELRDESPDCLFVVDARGPAAPLITDLEARMLEPIVTSSDDYGNACASFKADMENGKFRFPAPQPELEAAIAVARKQKLGDRWKFARASATSADITPLESVALAAWGYATHGKVPPRQRPRFLDLAEA